MTSEAAMKFHSMVKLNMLFTSSLRLQRGGEENETIRIYVCILQSRENLLQQTRMIDNQILGIFIVLLLGVLITIVGRQCIGNIIKVHGQLGDRGDQ